MICSASNHNLRVIKAWFEALNYWQSNPAEANAIIAEATQRTPEQIPTKGIKLFSLA